MPHLSTAPCLLLAMPQLDDPNFHRSVVLLCRADEEGTMGLVVNRPTSAHVGSVIDFDPPLAHDNQARAWIGGPVDPQRGWILIAADEPVAEAHAIAPGIYLSGSMLLLREMLESADAGRRRFLLGYAGWGEGQLDDELADSSWLTTEPEVDLIFDTPPEVMWETAIRRLGIEPFSLQSGGGVH